MKLQTALGYLLSYHCSPPCASPLPARVSLRMSREHVHFWHGGQFLLEVRLFPWISKDLGYVHVVFNLGCNLRFYSFATSHHFKSLPRIRGYYPNSVGNSADKSLGNPHIQCGWSHTPAPVLAELWVPFGSAGSITSDWLL